jgi:hypothetical protein
MPGLCHSRHSQLRSAANTQSCFFDASHCSARCSLFVLDSIPPLCFPPTHPGLAPRPRHDAARGSSGERRPTTTPLLPPQAALAGLRGWSAGRRLLAFPSASQTDGISQGASRDGTRNPVPSWRAATARGRDSQSQDQPPGGLASPQASPGAPFPCGKDKGTGGAHAEVKQQGGAALAKASPEQCAVVFRK